MLYLGERISAESLVRTAFRHFILPVQPFIMRVACEAIEGGNALLICEIIENRSKEFPESFPDLNQAPWHFGEIGPFQKGPPLSLFAGVLAEFRGKPNGSSFDRGISILESALDRHAESGNT